MYFVLHKIIELYGHNFTLRCFCLYTVYKKHSFVVCTNVYENGSYHDSRNQQLGNTFYQFWKNQCFLLSFCSLVTNVL